METLLTGWNGVHDFLSFLLVINLKSKKVLWSSQLELGGVGLLVVFNDDFFGFWQVLLLSSHNLDEFLQVLDFLWLYSEQRYEVRIDDLQLTKDWVLILAKNLLTIMLFP